MQFSAIDEIESLFARRVFRLENNDPTVQLRRESVLASANDARRIPALRDTAFRPAPGTALNTRSSSTFSIFQANGFALRKADILDAIRGQIAPGKICGAHLYHGRYRFRFHSPLR